MLHKLNINSFLLLFSLFVTSTNLYSQAKTDTVLRFYDIHNKIYLEKALNGEKPLLYYVDTGGKRAIIDTFIYDPQTNDFIKEYLKNGNLNKKLSYDLCDSMCHFYCVLMEGRGSFKEVRIISINEFFPYRPCSESNLLYSVKHDFKFERIQKYYDKRIITGNKKYPILVFMLLGCQH